MGNYPYLAEYLDKYVREFNENVNKGRDPKERINPLRHIAETVRKNRFKQTSALSRRIESTPSEKLEM